MYTLHAVSVLCTNFNKYYQLKICESPIFAIFTKFLRFFFDDLIMATYIYVMPLLHGTLQIDSSTM